MANAALGVGGRGNPRSSGYERTLNDHYVEPGWIVDALLDAEPFEGTIYDPACGGGNIPLRCRARGMESVGSDLVDRGFGETIDFFLVNEQHDNIICNPPFSLAQKFVEHALERTSKKVAIIQRLAFAEGQKRRLFFESTPISRILVSSRRACMPPGVGFKEGQEAEWGALPNQPGRGGAIAYAWFIWTRHHKGPPTFGWLP